LHVQVVTCQCGDVAFVFVSGDLALDFTGTLKWRRDDPEELLRTPADVAQWAVEAGILTEAPEISLDAFDRLRQLRESIYRLVQASLHERSWDSRDVEAVNTAAQGPMSVLALSADGLSRTGDGEAVAAVLARAAAELLARRGELALRECVRDTCTRVFIDRSRTGNRRWCGMEECGNRIKARHYRMRKVQAGAS
jgi:predicted RNA-binding Zn ribbon-like protein